MAKERKMNERKLAEINKNKKIMSRPIKATSSYLYYVSKGRWSSDV